MTFGEDFLRMAAPGAERLVATAGLLASRGLAYRVLPVAGRRHLFARAGEGPPALLLAAHYDRSPEGAGVLDNAAACLALADFRARLAGPGDGEGGGRPDARPSLLFLFTDGEEAPSAGSALDQGAYSLARGLREAFGFDPPPVLVLDVVGRGDRLVVSSSPATALASPPGRSPSPGTAEAMLRLERLESLARRAAAAAGLPAPLALPLPWSDDLGFLLGGVPALALSVLPEGEALAFARRGERPPTWDLLHGPGDRLEVLEESALAMVGRFLDALPAALAAAP